MNGTLGNLGVTMASNATGGGGPVIIPPNITLAVPQAGLHEIGESIANVSMNAVATKGTNALTKVEFLVNGIVMNTVNNPNGGNTGPVSYVYPGPVTVDTTFQAKVYTASESSVSAVAAISFTNKVYRGGDANVSINETQIEALENSSLHLSYAGNYVYVTEPATYKYICYPSSRGNLNLTVGPLYAVRDALNQIVAVTKLADVSVTNSYGSTTAYAVYRSVNIVGGADSWTII